ncbi:type 2 periplasmic-binding domain-containing protein [Halalkalicoccus ordinarius]|uniref:hypothetical protein n=1 Tax=Halalkalicoccus ordinarius TaxID=3116651 RepID=UPI00300F7B0C
MNGSRRAFLAATGAAVATGIGGQPAASTNAEAKTAEGVAVSGDAPALADVLGRFEREHPDVRVSAVDGKFDRFLRSETDVHHATRPMTADERERASENGVEFTVAELPLGGIAALGQGEGWCRCHRERDGDAFEDRDGVATWSELPGKVPADLDPADLPEEGTDVLVCGTRPHQYATGHGGVGLYEAAPAAFAPFDGGDDRLTPVVGVEFAYVDRAALEREPVAALSRFQEAATSDVEPFPIDDG